MSKKWTKYEHVAFVEDRREGRKVYEILRKENIKTGESKYKRVYVKDCVHGLSQKLITWWHEYRN